MIQSLDEDTFVKKFVL